MSEGVAYRRFMFERNPSRIPPHEWKADPDDPSVCWTCGQGYPDHC